MTLPEARQALEGASARIADLERRPAWFQRTLFGRRSERRVTGIPPPRESLFDAAGIPIGPEPAWESPETPDPAGPRRKTRPRGNRNRDNAVSEAGLRFDAGVPVETVVLPGCTAEGIPEAERELVDEHVVHRLARDPGSCRIIRHVTPVHRRRGASGFATPPAPPSVPGGPAPT